MIRHKSKLNVCYGCEKELNGILRRRSDGAILVVCDKCGYFNENVINSIDMEGE